MPIKMKELPTLERPYEKLELYGEKSLSNSELLAIIIKTGTKNIPAITIAQEILNLQANSDKEDLKFLTDISLTEFMKIKGIGRVKAIQLKAVCELTKRMSRPINNNRIVVRTSKDIANLLIQELRYEKREIAKVVLLNSKNVILKIVDISLGRFKFCLYRAKKCTVRSNKNASTKDNTSAQSPKSEIVLLAKEIFL